MVRLCVWGNFVYTVFVLIYFVLTLYFVQCITLTNITTRAQGFRKKVEYDTGVQFLDVRQFVIIGNSIFPVE